MKTTIKSSKFKTDEFKIKGIAKRVEKKNQDLKKIQDLYKQYEATKSKVIHLEEKKNNILKQSLLPFMQKELKFIKMINTDSREQFNKAQRQFIKEIIGDEHKTTAFIKKHVKHI
ncbi:hypothetical protein INT48_000084 [Thamnidium elegans]|uniref:Uncharacterized protein n=1 Tax=Thamnidium elegans TaxID=101142 RepID=A0A8H7SIE2_9FUNG|nr:hypothetical protein INT48_000084 [Thamnidium elegans]